MARATATATHGNKYPNGEEEEEEEEVIGECTCGYNYGSKENTALSPRSRQQQQQCSTTATTLLLDASFVHLNPSVLLQPPEEEQRWQQSSPPLKRQLQQQLRSSDADNTVKTTVAGNFRHLEALERAANDGGPISSSDAPSSSAARPLHLCIDCVRRAEDALNADAERLENECRAYRHAILDEEDRLRGLDQALRVAAGAASLGTHNNNSDQHAHDDQRQEEHTTIERMGQAVSNEVEMLRRLCEQHEEELVRLRELRIEQAGISHELDQLENAIEEEKNSLELEARAFDNDQEQLYRNLMEAQDEVERLSSARLGLLDLKVDKERGLRYPLINELRLAYRPKGDVQSNEIQVAWSLAAQLLLAIATLFDFQSSIWRIVPLSHCAKLIYYHRDDVTTTTTTTSTASNSSRETTTAAETTKDDNEHDPSEEGDGGHRKNAIVYNLGHPKTNKSKALLAWNALLYQVIEHAKTKLKNQEDSLSSQEDQERRGGAQQPPPQPDSGGTATPAPSRQIPPPIPPLLVLPYDMSPTTIGGIALSKLDENDDAGWSGAIHYMASNLLWLSECASTFLLQRVVLRSSSAAAVVLASSSEAEQQEQQQ